MIGSIHQLETVERLIRRGVYTGPLVLNHMALAAVTPAAIRRTCWNSCAAVRTARC